MRRGTIHRRRVRGHGHAALAACSGSTQRGQPDVAYVEPAIARHRMPHCGSAVCSTRSATSNSCASMPTPRRRAHCCVEKDQSAGSSSVTACRATTAGDHDRARVHRSDRGDRASKWQHVAGADRHDETHICQRASGVGGSNRRGHHIAAVRVIRLGVTKSGRTRRQSTLSATKCWKRCEVAFFRTSAAPTRTHPERLQRAQASLPLPPRRHRTPCRCVRSGADRYPCSGFTALVVDRDAAGAREDGWRGSAVAFNRRVRSARWWRPSDYPMRPPRSRNGT